MTTITRKTALEIALSALTADSYTVTVDDKEIAYAADDVTAVLEKMIASLDKQASKPRKPSAKTAENDALRASLLTALADCENPVSIPDLLGVDGFEGFTSQRMSALLSPLVKAGKVVKTYEGKTAKFALATN